MIKKATRDCIPHIYPLNALWQPFQRCNAWIPKKQNGLLQAETTLSIRINGNKVHAFQYVSHTIALCGTIVPLCMSFGTSVALALFFREIYGNCD